MCLFTNKTLIYREKRYNFYLTLQLLIIIIIYLFHTQSTHIDKSYINSNTIIHRINDKYIIMPGHISVNKILRNNHK